MRWEYYLRCNDELLSFCKRFPFIVLYGSGYYGAAVQRHLDNNSIQVNAFCVTQKGTNTIHGLEQYTIHDLPYSIEDCGIILSLREELQKEVKTALMLQNNKIQFLALQDEFMRYICYILKKDSNEYYPIECYEALKEYIQCPTVIIKRNAGLGDVISSEPIVRKIISMGFHVFYETENPFGIHHRHPEVIPLKMVPDFLETSSIVIDLNMSYEVAPLQHILDAYIDKVREVFPSFSLEGVERIPQYDLSFENKSVLDKPKRICVNIEGTWDSRTYPHSKTKQFFNYLVQQGYEVFEIGLRHELYLGVGKDCFGFTLDETAAFMKTMDLYVGMDGGLMHLAQAIGLPVFILFGCICPNFRIHDWSKARVMWKNIDQLSCAGCHHRRLAPHFITECDNINRHECMAWSVQEVINAFETEKYDNPPKLQKEMYLPL